MNLTTVTVEIQNYNPSAGPLQHLHKYSLDFIIFFFIQWQEFKLTHHPYLTIIIAVTIVISLCMSDLFLLSMPPAVPSTYSLQLVVGESRGTHADDFLRG